jgi:hypothetical protein
MQSLAHSLKHSETCAAMQGQAKNSGSIVAYPVPSQSAPNVSDIYTLKSFSRSLTSAQRG